ncbi:WD40-repeat-containing domain protein [Pilobolus umbonatus]|nr:WD40-repeat-containing domain protein [Pilobolus umbonatus]
MLLMSIQAFKVDCKDMKLENMMIYGPKTDFYPSKDKSISCIDISPNGNLFAAGNGSEICVGSVVDGKSQKIFSGHLSDVTTVQFFPSNLVLLSGGADFLLKIWSVLNGSNPVTLKGHTSAITSTAIVSTGRNVLSSSRDGTVKLWNCGTSSTLATMGHYDYPINKMILVDLPASLGPTKQEDLVLDPLEIETGDKLVIVAVGDGSIRGIHLGTKKEIFATPATGTPSTAVAYDPLTNSIIAGNEKGLLGLFALDKDMSKPRLQWKRSGYAVTAIVTKLNEKGEAALCISNADGAIYQTAPIQSILSSGIKIEAEYTGNELEPVYDMKTMVSEHPSGLQRIACGVRDGSIKIY